MQGPPHPAGSNLEEMPAMRYLGLACDYDGTLATAGTVDEPTLDALRRLKAAGRRLILVTGRPRIASDGQRSARRVHRRTAPPPRALFEWAVDRGHVEAARHHRVRGDS